MKDTLDPKPKKEVIKIESLHENHPKMRASDWRSPLIRRLIGSDKYTNGEKLLTNSFRSPSSHTVEDEMQLAWSGLKDDFLKCINTYQEPIITEFATLGLACILVTLKTNLEITEVTRRGEKADYWIGDKEFLIEVSGQQEGNLEDLCKKKAKQLLENPFHKCGYVCVANYTEIISRLWYYNEDGANGS